MNGTRTGMGWGARLMIASLLIIVGAAAATWGLAPYGSAARFLGVVSAREEPVMLTPKPVVVNPQPAPQPLPAPQAQAQDQKIAELETRVAAVENATARAVGSAGRAD